MIIIAIIALISIPITISNRYTAHDIRVVEILEAVDETVDALQTGAGASGGVSGSRAQSVTNRLWEGLSAQVYVYLLTSEMYTSGREPSAAAPKAKPSEMYVPP